MEKKDPTVFVDSYGKIHTVRLISDESTSYESSLFQVVNDSV
tara:strand:- start:43 stop:168 length:126 start_codon:yes stop_codon:yes gene_type:complete